MSVAYSFDGKTLASTDGDGIVLWDAATGKRIKPLVSNNVQGQGRINGVDAIAFSPRAHQLAAHYGEGSLICWDLTTGNEFLMEVIKPTDNRLPLGLAEYRGLAYSPSGAMLAVNWAGKTTVFETSFGRILQSIGTAGDNLQFGLAWSPDNTQVAQGSHNVVARLCKISDGDI